MSDGPVRIKTRVYLEDAETVECWVDNRDFVRWDLERERHGWPDASVGKFLFQTYCAWSACQRSQQLDGMNFDEFSRRAISIAEAETETVVPFAAEAGSV